MAEEDYKGIRGGQRTGNLGQIDVEMSIAIGQCKIKPKDLEEFIKSRHNVKD